MSKWEYALLALGVLIFAIGVLLMVEGHILGERTTGITTLLGIGGVFILTILNMRIMLQKAKKAKKELCWKEM